MTTRRELIRRAYIDACYHEIDALKPGNVHRFADGHNMKAAEFFDSAQASSAAIADPALCIGERILAAVWATREKVGTNTNLGIVLLCAPLAKAAESGGLDLRLALNAILDGLDIEDARQAFAAIVLAQPGGLGSARRHDVANKPEVTLLEAMREAANRDMIACQYATGFADIFEGGFAAHDAAIKRGEEKMWPVVFVYLHYLSAFADSHIVRKFGKRRAEKTRRQAAAILERVKALTKGTEREKLLLAFDAELKNDGINPGTSADLTVATLFALQLNLVLHIRQVND